MNDVSLTVDHDIPVVSILDLKYIAGDRIGCHRLDEVQSSLLELHGVRTTIACHEKGEEVIDLCSTHFVPRCGIWNDVNDPTLKLIVSACKLCQLGSCTYSRCSGGNSIREEIQHETESGEDVLEHGNNLQREDVLAAVIADFEDRSLPYIILGDASAHFARFVQNLIWVGNYFFFLLLHFESGHKRGLITPWLAELGTRSPNPHLSVALQGSAGLLVDIHNLSIGITR